MITQEILKEYLQYFPETGVFKWVKTSSNRAKKGNIAGGSTVENWYATLSFMGKQYLAHRLAWFYMTGSFPEKHIDHINHDKTDNRWSNLRQADEKTNGRNMSKQKRNKSGVTGIRLNKKYNKWQVEIIYNRKYIYLGFYDYFFEAVCARKSAENKYGFHPNHGM